MTTYTDAAAIEAYLGVTFTPEQEALAETFAEAATSFVDRYTGRTWQTVSPATGETLPVLPAPGGTSVAAGQVFLRHAPVSAVTAVALRTAYPNDPPTTLDAVTWELVDPAHGVLTVAGGSGWSGGLFAVVDYTYSDAVPPDIAMATTMIAAGVMQQQRTGAAIAAQPQLAGVESISVGQNDVSVRLSSSATKGASASSAAGSAWAAPGSAVAMILDRYRKPVIA